MNIITDEGGPVCVWVADKIGVEQFWGPHRGIGVERDGQIIAGVVVHDYNGANIEMSLAGRACLSRVARAYFNEFVFQQLGCRRVTARTRASNAKVRSMAERLGFVFEATLCGFYPDDDAVIYALFP